MTWRAWAEALYLPDGLRQMPVERPERTAADMTGTRRDGTLVDIRRSLGLPAAPAPDADEGVRWTAWPPR